MENQARDEKEHGPDIQAVAKSMIAQGFSLFADHSRKMAEDLTAFDARFKENKAKIDAGTRRTNGRIV